MARTIKGTIKHGGTGLPIAGANVIAWDADSKYASNDDKMGEDTTNRNGYYEIHYARGDWDPPNPLDETERPDIFIRVKVKDALDNWELVHRSSTRSNHRRSEDLTINANVWPHPYYEMVHGRITYPGGDPVPNAHVTVFTDLFPDAPSEIGAVNANPDGSYIVAGLYGPSSDVYVVVDRVVGGIVQRFSSPILADVRDLDGAKIDLEIPPP